MILINAYNDSWETKPGAQIEPERPYGYETSLDFNWREMQPPLVYRESWGWDLVTFCKLIT